MDDFTRANDLLDSGRGEEALVIFRRLAEDDGRLDAMHSIAHTYLYGIAGVPVDYDQSFAWFTRAANLGCPQAMYHLGLSNAKGYGTLVNPVLSAAWYRRSAENDDEDAMYELGLCYEKGFGVPEDAQAALDWFRRAARLGQEQAKEKLAR